MGQQEPFSNKTAVGIAYATLVAAQASATSQAFTFERALDEQVAKVDGTSTTRRPSELDRVAKIENDLLAAVQALREGGS